MLNRFSRARAWFRLRRGPGAVVAELLRGVLLLPRLCRRPLLEVDDPLLPAGFLVALPVREYLVAGHPRVLEKAPPSSRVGVHRVLLRTEAVELVQRSLVT